MNHGHGFPFQNRMSDWSVSNLGADDGPSTRNPSPTGTPQQRRAPVSTSKRLNISNTGTAKKRRPNGPANDTQSNESAKGWWKHMKMESFPANIPAF